MTRPITTRRYNGEYSTVHIGGGIIETMWFPDEGEPRLVNRTGGVSKIHRQDVERDENQKPPTKRIIIDLGEDQWGEIRGILEDLNDIGIAPGFITVEGV